MKWDFWAAPSWPRALGAFPRRTNRSRQGAHPPPLHRAPRGSPGCRNGWNFLPHGHGTEILGSGRRSRGAALAASHPDGCTGGRGTGTATPGSRFLGGVRGFNSLPLLRAWVCLARSQQSSCKLQRAFRACGISTSPPNKLFSNNNL